MIRNAVDARSLHYSQEISKLEDQQPENIKIKKHSSCVANKKDIVKRNKAQTLHRNAFLIDTLILSVAD